MIKFIHTSDIHLDMPLQLDSHLPEKVLTDVVEASFTSFKKLVDDAINEQVDFIIISGGLFHHEYPSIRAYQFIQKQFNRLNDAHIFVYYICGNEDYLNFNTYMEIPNNVIVFGQDVSSYELITNNGTRVYLHGFSYFNEDSLENKIDRFPVVPVDQSIHIGLLHGTYAKSDIKKRITEFQVEDLNSKMYHYWALGHNDNAQFISDIPHIHYSGTIQANSFDCLGDKGYLLVTGDHIDLNVSFVKTSTITFNKAEITLSEVGKHAIYQDITDFKESVRNQGKQFYQLTIHNPHETLVDQAELRKILTEVQQFEANEVNFVFIDQIQLNEAHAVYTLDEEFRDEFLNDEMLYYQSMADIRASKAKKYMDPLKLSDKSMLLKHGEAILKSVMRDDA